MPIFRANDTFSFKGISYTIMAQWTQISYIATPATITDNIAFKASLGLTYKLHMDYGNVVYIYSYTKYEEMFPEGAKSWDKYYGV